MSLSRRLWFLFGMAGVVVVTLVAAMACGGGKSVSAPTSGTGVERLPNQLFAAHYVDSYPAHGEVFALVPDRVQIDFNFTLHEISSIQVTRDGSPLAVAKPSFGARNLSMWTTLPNAAGNGLYVVQYKACWPDRSCHDGQFTFTVDGAARSSYVDMTGKREVRIDMQGSRFRPAKVVISKGTTVVWTNGEAVAHFVNTDPHPSHNVLPNLNSLALDRGQMYSYTFNEPGEWGYHCSAHYPEGMVGHVIVQP